MLRSTSIIFLIVVALLLHSPWARATTFVPMSVADLTRSSIASIVGTVRNTRALQSKGGAIFTLVEINVQEIVHGDLPPGPLTLKELGGTVGTRSAYWFGTPSFHAGERVFLFLTTHADGSLRTNHLALGKFRIENFPPHGEVARRTFGPGTTVLTPRSSLTNLAGIPLTELIAEVRFSAAAIASPQSEAMPRSAPPEAADSSLPTDGGGGFSLVAPTARLFEVDEHHSVRFMIDGRGDSILGLEASRAAVGDALAAWSDVPSSAILLRDAGLTDDISADCVLPHRVRFDDPADPDHPDGIISPPVNCSGTLALGGFCTTSAETKTIGGTTFVRAVRSMLTLADGWDGCEEWTPCNLAELATHELGHAIGLGHSSENEFESNPLLTDATMYFLAHFDGRCAALRQDDRDGIGFIYPTEVPPAIRGARHLPDAFTGNAYNHALIAEGGSGPLTWSLLEGGVPGLSLSPDGVISGTPQAHGNSVFRAKVTDSAGDSHTADFDINVYLPWTPSPATTTASPTETPTVPPSTATPSPTASSTETQEPDATPTPTWTFEAAATDTPSALPSPSTTATSPLPTGTATPSPAVSATPQDSCAGDCNGDGTVTVYEVITGVNIALGSVGTESCRALDTDSNGLVTVNELITAVNAALAGCPE